MAEWKWVLEPDSLLDDLPAAARTEVERLAREITVRDSLLYPDGRSYTGRGPGLQFEYRERLVLAYLADVRGEQVVLVQVTWLG